MGKYFFGLLSQLFDLCTMVIDIECQWICRNTECHVVMATLHDSVGVYTCIHSHYYMSTLLCGAYGGTESLDRRAPERELDRTTKYDSHV